jgi:predicted DNA repair protein MutK
MIKLTTASLLATLFVLPALAAPAPQADTAGSPAAGVKPDDGLRNPTTANGVKPDDGLPAAKRAANGPDDGLRNPTSTNNGMKPDDGLHTDNPKAR